jgi:CheY-like chemotaxis protein
MLRADPAWANTPVVCLTPELDLDSYRRGYRAGADDFVTAPFQSGELAARITHRLDRAHQRTGLRDNETGLPEAPLFRSLLEQLLTLADRYGEPVTVGRLRLRRPRQLGRLATELQAHLRPTDILGIWGPGELAVARLGEASENALWLDPWIHAEEGVVAYAGLAGFPEIPDAEALLGEAERRLRHAIEQGPRQKG